MRKGPFFSGRSVKASGLFTACLIALIVCQRGVSAQPPQRAQTPPRSTGSALHEAVSGLSDWASAQKGVLAAAVLDVGSGATRAEANPYALVNPASNQKLLTAAVALDRLGPDYRFVTGLYGEVVENRVPRLVLRGHGDPSLEARHMFRLAQALVFRGVSKVDALCVDQSRFDQKFVPPAFDQQPDEWAAFRAPVSAVAIAQNSLTLNVMPSASGAPARVWLEPPGFALTRGQIETRAPGQGQSIEFALKPSQDRLVAVLSGHIAAGLGRVRISRRVDDPRTFAGHVLKYQLSQLGVDVPSTVAVCGEDETKNLLYIESSPLSQLLYRMGKNSDNFYAEMLLKALGAEANGSPATSAQGAAVVAEWLRQKGAFVPGMRITNGSGLFDANRVTARSIVQLLRVVYNDPRLRPDYLAQLAVGGVDGTLRSRFRKTLRRRVRAKTGSLNRVVALSGYVLGSGARAYAFALIVNGIAGKHAEIRARIDRVVEAIARDLSATGRR